MIQLTTKDQPILNEWYSKAVNDPTVRPFLSLSNYSQELVIQPNDWETTYFMDEAYQTLLSVFHNRYERSVAITLFTLSSKSSKPSSSSKALRFIAKQLPLLYDLQHISFVISAENKEWLAAVQKRFLVYQWGIEPLSAYHSITRMFHGTHKFKIPTTALIPTT
jgi:hypothetical protein